MTFKAKLWGALALAVIALIAVSVVGAIEERSTLLAQRQVAMSEQIDAALSVVNHFIAQSRSGRLSEEAAKAAAVNHLRLVRYAKTGYISVVNSASIQLLSPMSPKWEGKFVDFVDPTGKHLIPEILKHAKDGSYVTYYQWARPGTNDLSPVRKVTYGRYVPEWDWTVFTGDYIDDVDDEFKTILLRSLSLVAVIAAVLITVMSLLVGNVLRTIGGDPAYVAQICERIAAGDIAEPVKLSPGDTSSLLHTMGVMQRRLSEAIRRIHVRADAITSGLREIADGNLDLSSRTEEQASSLAQTAASMDELTSAVRQNAENAQQANHLVVEASATIDAGSAVVSRVVSTMSEISSSARRIEDIIGVIEGIAFQTNILALNASVEAARAGDHGRGFSVVASEVRNLAQRSAGAAKDVRSLIAASSDKVTDGETYARHAGEAMTTILRDVSRVIAIMEEISAASDEQRRGIEHVGVAVAQMDVVTQQNAALVEESAAATSALADQAVALRQAVSTFRI